MIAPIEVLIFACLTFSFLLSCVLVRRFAAPAGPPIPALRQRPGRSLASRDGLTGQLDNWIENTTVRSGLPTNGVTVLVAASAVAILCGVGAQVGGLSMPFPVLFAMAGFAVVWLVLYALAIRRQKQFVEHFPSAVEMMARSIQAGESFEEALETASKTVAEPVASELKRLAQELTFGMQLATSMNSFARRNPITDVKIFANTVSLHREMGGRLAETLARLAEVIRTRGDYLRKVKSATSLGRYAAIGITSAAFLVLAYMLVVHPDYISKLWESDLGMNLVYYGIASEVVGLVWVAMTLRQEY